MNARHLLGTDLIGDVLLERIDLFDKEVDIGLIAVSRTEAAAMCNQGMPYSKMTQR